MSQSIFEYKDDENWFVGQWADQTSLTRFNAQDDFIWLGQDLSNQLVREGGFQIHLIKCQSALRLITFVVEMINANTNSELAVVSHHSTIIVSEGEHIRYIYLPKEGVSREDFFGKELEASANFGETILIATRNKGKTKEFSKLFGQLGIKVEDLNDYPDLPEVEETGMTFEENARLKAETISKITGKMVLSDDSGLMVDVLGGLPGVWSARFSGPDATDAANNAKLLHELAMVFEMKDRKAHFHTTLVVAAPDRESLVVDADWDGYIAQVPKGDHGFGYDPLFLVGETGRTAAELSSDEKNTQSHRGQAVKKLMEVFPKWQNAH